jgi:hypothetical protein
MAAWGGLHGVERQQREKFRLFNSLTRSVWINGFFVLHLFALLNFECVVTTYSFADPARKYRRAAA